MEFFDQVPKNWYAIRPSLICSDYNRYEIIEQNLFVNFNFKTITNKFDIIFLDPPYKEKKFNHIIDSITEKKVLNKNGIIIIHRHKKDDDKFSDNFKLILCNARIERILFLPFLSSPFNSFNLV